MLNEDLSEDQLNFFCTHMNHWIWVYLDSGTQFTWITLNTLQKRSIGVNGFPLPLALTCLHSQRETRIEGLQTS